MKTVRLVSLFMVVFIAGRTLHAAEIIDGRTVYSPDINICVSSFGGLIQSQEVVILPGAAGRIHFAKKLLINWIAEKNDPGFYLKELDSSQFYWQFIETRSFAGIILFVADAPIAEEFYHSLGSGLSVPGKKTYGTSVPWNSTSDIFSFVINKKTGHLEHFENWRFSDGVTAPKWMTKSKHKDLMAGCHI